MNKTLYVSDLDGTLIRHDLSLSETTTAILNQALKKGCLFTYATARSLSTASVLTAALPITCPVILYNGVFIIDPISKEKRISHFFAQQDAAAILYTLMKHDIHPLVYTDNGAERYSYSEPLIQAGVREFLATRPQDERNHPMTDLHALALDRVFYFTCIGDEAQLYPMYCRFQTQFSCFYQKDIYSGRQWLEILPPHVSKANAVLELKRQLACDTLIVFGDGVNDMPMFQAADESYAVANAADALKQIATGVIASHEEDGVAKWMQKRLAHTDR